MIRCYSLIQSRVARWIGGQGCALGGPRRVVVRGGGGGVVRRGRFAASSSIDAAVVSVLLAGLQSEVVLLAGVGIILVL